METKPAVRRPWLWLIPILFLGFGLRALGLYWGQGYCSIGPSDALEAYSVSVDYLCGEPKAAYLGQPNYNSHAKLPGPLWTLFCVAGLRLWGSVEGVVAGLILVNTAAILVTYLLTQKIFGAPASLWAALLAATLPFSIYYSVSVYNPNVMQLLGGLLFLALWEVVRQERSRAVFWVGFLLLLMPQFHMCVTMLLPALVLVLVLAAARLNRPWLLGGLLAGALLYVPYLRGEMSHGWQNTLGMMSVRSGYSWGGLKALTAPLSLLTNWVPQWTHSFNDYRALGRACFGWLGVFLAVNVLSGLMALLLVGRTVLDLKKVLAGVWQSPRAVFRHSPGLVFLSVMVAVPLGLAAVSGKNFRTHYALVLFPALLGLAGAAAAKLCSSRRGEWVAGLLALVTGANVWFMAAMFYDQGVRIEHGPVFLASFRQLESVYQQLKRNAGPNRGVRVEDQAYLQSFPRKERELLESRLLRSYVAIREKQCAGGNDAVSGPVTYRLCRADKVRPDDPRVVFRGQGIALSQAGTD